MKKVPALFLDRDGVIIKDCNYIKDPNNVEIVHGDTSKIPFGMGTYGSRSLAVCGSAIVRGVEKIISNL